MLTNRLNEKINIMIIYYTAWSHIVAHASNWHKTEVLITMVLYCPHSCIYTATTSISLFTNVLSHLLRNLPKYGLVLKLLFKAEDSPHCYDLHFFVYKRAFQRTRLLPNLPKYGLVLKLLFKAKQKIRPTATTSISLFTNVLSRLLWNLPKYGLVLKLLFKVEDSPHCYDLHFFVYKRAFQRTRLLPNLPKYGLVLKLLFKAKQKIRPTATTSIVLFTNLLAIICFYSTVDWYLNLFLK